MIAPKFSSRVHVSQLCIQNSQRCSFVKEKFNHRQPVADVADDKRNNAGRGWSNFRCLACEKPQSPRIPSSEQNIQAPTKKRDHGSGENGLHVQDLVVNSGFQRKKWKIILPIRWPD